MDCRSGLVRVFRVGFGGMSVEIKIADAAEWCDVKIDRHGMNKQVFEVGGFMSISPARYTNAAVAYERSASFIL